MDQISGLPKNVLHDILSKLPQKDAFRTSVLSKAWRETWSTFPVLSISDGHFIGTFPQPDEDFKRKRNIFLEYLKKTLLRFCDQGVAVKEFKLNVNCFDLHFMSQDMDHWLKFASESGVEVIDLALPDGPEQNEDGLDICYTLKPGVLEARSLHKLMLLGGIRVDIAFWNQSIRFLSLRVLSLWSVVVGDEGAIEHFISCCPLIEQITLKCCFVYKPLSIGNLLVSKTSPLKSLSMSGLQKLKGVDVQGTQEVYIDAPNLENLCYCYPGDNVDVPFKLVLEILKLVYCTVSERIKISSAQLKVLELSNCSNLKEVNIDAPNLLTCG